MTIFLLYRSHTLSCFDLLFCNPPIDEVMAHYPYHCPKPPAGSKASTSRRVKAELQLNWRALKSKSFWHGWRSRTAHNAQKGASTSMLRSNTHSGYRSFFRVRCKLPKEEWRSRRYALTKRHNFDVLSTRFMTGDETAPQPQQYRPASCQPAKLLQPVSESAKGRYRDSWPLQPVKYVQPTSSCPSRLCGRSEFSRHMPPSESRTYVPHEWQHAPSLQDASPRPRTASRCHKNTTATSERKPAQRGQRQNVQPVTKPFSKSCSCGRYPQNTRRANHSREYCRRSYQPADSKLK